MPSKNRLYFSLFVNTDLREKALREGIVSALTGQFESKSEHSAFGGCKAMIEEIASSWTRQINLKPVRGTYAEYDVRKNDEFSRKRSQQGDQDSFLFYRYKVEVEPTSADVQIAAYLNELSRVVTSLKEAGALVVAVGDYEEELKLRLSASHV